MERISRRGPPPSTTHADVVIVGSGYGAAVAASRLARVPGLRVIVLERGAEIPTGDFPATALDAASSLARHPKGIFDLHTRGDIAVMVGRGLGGGSLINAGVALAHDDSFFSGNAWPAVLRCPTVGSGDVARPMSHWYQRARAMLAPTPYPTNWPELASPSILLASASKVAAELGQSVVGSRPPICVSFAEASNAASTAMKACTLCGNCCSGCNYDAKSTTVVTYLADAARFGAEIHTEVDVTTLRRLGRRAGRGRRRWEIEMSADGALSTITASVVILGAGTIGSTGILLRSGAKGLALSSKVGHRFSSNGDVLGYVTNVPEPTDGTGGGPYGRVGPTIGAMLTVGDDGNPVTIQESIVPGPLAPLMPAVLFSSEIFGDDGPGYIRRDIELLERAVSDSIDGTNHGPSAHVLTLLAMARDRADGQITLEHDGLSISGPSEDGDDSLALTERAFEAVAASVGGTFVANPMRGHVGGRRAPITVHPLGGASMADTGADGAVDHRGGVFTGDDRSVHDGLFVMDGSVIPCALGINPLLTITALAERSVALLCEERAWLPASGPTPPTAQVGTSLTFDERMSGTVTLTDTRAVLPIEFRLTMTVDSMEHLLHQPGYAVSTAGTMILGKHPVPCEGTFVLCDRDPATNTAWHMLYTLHFEVPGPDGHLVLEGIKTIRDDRHFDLWHDSTKLEIALWRSSITGQRLLDGTGTMRIGVLGTVKMASSVRVDRQLSWRRRWKAKRAFAAGFLGNLASTYLDRWVPESPSHPRALVAPEPTVDEHVTPRNGRIRLTRYRGGTLGPVILAPGFGVTASSFGIDTVEQNLVEYLCAHHYDVWLFDYRSSPSLPSAASQHTFDDIAALDWPDAIRSVVAATGCATVQVIAHCFAAATLQMSILDGNVTGLVRTAVCSQTTIHPRVGRLIRLKIALRVPELMVRAGLGELRTTRGATLLDVFGDIFLRAYPRGKGQRCRSPFCARVWAVYGPTYRHEKLNDATHSAIHRYFKVSNMTAFLHAAQMIRAGQAVHFQPSGRGMSGLLDGPGRSYITEFEALRPTERARRLNLDLTLVSCDANRLFTPKSSRATMAWWAKHKPATSQVNHLKIDGYGHMDLFLGSGTEHVAAVYDRFRTELERSSQARGVKL